MNKLAFILAGGGSRSAVTVRDEGQALRKGCAALTQALGGVASPVWAKSAAEVPCAVRP